MSGRTVSLSNFSSPRSSQLSPEKDSSLTKIDINEFKKVYTILVHVLQHCILLQYI